MTRVPEPSAAAVAALRQRAEQAEALAAGQRDALSAVREAIGIPHAATVGDDEIRTAILMVRVMHLSVFLDSVLRDEPADLSFSVAYLREQLAMHPAEGYRTDYAEVMADWAAARADGLDATGLPDCGAS